jgi:hypothetical protein
MPVRTMKFHQLFILAHPGRFTGILLHAHFFRQADLSGPEFVPDRALVADPAPKAVVGLKKIGDRLAAPHDLGQFAETPDPDYIDRFENETQANQGKKLVSGKLAPMFPLIDNPIREAP